jgi:4-nitrophenol 2-monooxygenase / 4-nitrocatechol 4-monooxygenase, reductase component
MTLADHQEFRDVIGRFASGVTIITTSVDGAPFGTTASAVSSLSLEPPMVLICLNKSSSTQAAILKAGHFCVNILADGQQDLAYQFAGKGDKFAGTAFEQGIEGIPVLGGTLAHLECRVAETVTGGTHTVFLAHVAVAAGHEGAPLTYFRGRFGRLESVREEEAYAAVRAWVLTRQMPLDQALEPGALAAAMDLEAPHVAYALVRLAGEHVVSRTADGRYLPIPLTIELADQLFGARCVIELGVADVAVGRIADDDIAVLDGYAQRLAAVVAADDATLDEFLDTSHGYHMHFVGLGGSPQLRETYNALGISVLWRRAMDGMDWRSKFDVVHHAALTQACRDGDVARARDLISEHTEQVRGLVRTLIDRAGGAL